MGKVFGRRLTGSTWYIKTTFTRRFLWRASTLIHTNIWTNKNAAAVASPSSKAYLQRRTGTSPSLVGRLWRAREYSRQKTVVVSQVSYLWAVILSSVYCLLIPMWFPLVSICVDSRQRRVKVVNNSLVSMRSAQSASNYSFFACPP